MISSGSFVTRGMAVAPCSMRTLAAISTGSGTNLIHRAADVVLKERRKLVLVPREAPLSDIHLEHMLRLSRMGDGDLPPVPAFYQRPAVDRRPGGSHRDADPRPVRPASRRRRPLERPDAGHHRPGADVARGRGVPSPHAHANRRRSPSARRRVRPVRRHPRHRRRPPPPPPRRPPPRRSTCWSGWTTRPSCSSTPTASPRCRSTRSASSSTSRRRRSPAATSTGISATPTTSRCAACSSRSCRTAPASTPATLAEIAALHEALLDQHRPVQQPHGAQVRADVHAARRSPRRPRAGGEERRHASPPRPGESLDAMLARHAAALLRRRPSTRWSRRRRPRAARTSCRPARTTSMRACRWPTSRASPSATASTRAW